MATNTFCEGRLFRVLTSPIFPKALTSQENNSGHNVAFLLLIHIVSGMFVFIAVFAAEQARSDEAKTGNWAIVMTFVIMGLVSLIVLMVRGCQNKLKIEVIEKSSAADKSLSLRITFLWIFMLAVAIQVSINFAIYIDCFESYSLRSVRVVFSLLSNIILLLYLLVQTSFISYYRDSPFVHDSVVNIASILIIATNFALWFNTMVSSINVFDLYNNKTVPQYSNESYCFRTSSIQVELSRRITPYLSQLRMEFCILASSFIISFWRWPMELNQDSAEDNNRIAQAKRDKYQIISNHRPHAVKGPYVFITVIGVLINTPLFIASLLQAFFAVNIGKLISSFGSIIAIYACSYILTKRYKSFWRSLKLTTNEHILILASSGMMAVFMLDLLMALASPNSVTMFASSRVVCMLEIYLQTYFLIKIKRYRTNGQSCIIISSSAILLMITNLVCWFLDSYNLHKTSVEVALVEKETWLYIQNAMIPLLTLYRLFSGIISYSVYTRFKPN